MPIAEVTTPASLFATLKIMALKNIDHKILIIVHINKAPKYISFLSLQHVISTKPMQRYNIPRITSKGTPPKIVALNAHTNFFINLLNLKFIIIKEEQIKLRYTEENTIKALRDHLIRFKYLETPTYRQNKYNAAKTGVTMLTERILDKPFLSSRNFLGKKQ